MPVVVVDHEAIIFLDMSNSEVWDCVLIGLSAVACGLKVLAPPKRPSTASVISLKGSGNCKKKSIKNHHRSIVKVTHTCHIPGLYNMAIALGKRKRATVTTKPVTQPRPLKAPKAAPKPARKPVAPSVPSPAVTKAQSEEKEGDESDSEDLQAIFRRAFEAKFKPLPDAEHKQKTEAIAAPEDEDEEMEEGEGEEDDDAWDGISEVADEVEVIEHADVRRAPEERLDKRQMRAFMVLQTLCTMA